MRKKGELVGLRSGGLKSRLILGAEGPASDLCDRFFSLSLTSNCRHVLDPIPQKRDHRDRCRHFGRTLVVDAWAGFDSICGGSSFGLRLTPCGAWLAKAIFVFATGPQCFSCRGFCTAGGFGCPVLVDPHLDQRNSFVTTTAAAVSTSSLPQAK